MKKTVFLVSSMLLLLFVFTGLSFGTVIHDLNLIDLDFNNGEVGEHWNFGEAYVENGALIFDAKHQEPYVQLQLPVNAGFPYYQLEYEMMAENFVNNGFNAFAVLFDTPTVAVFEAFTDGSLNWRTHSPSSVHHNDLANFQNDEWMKFTFQLDVPGNKISIFQNDNLIHKGHLGASSNDIRSIRFSLGSYCSYYAKKYSPDNRIFIYFF